MEQETAQTWYKTLNPFRIDNLSTSHSFTLLLPLLLVKYKHFVRDFEFPHYFFIRPRFHARLPLYLHTPIKKNDDIFKSVRLFWERDFSMWIRLSKRGLSGLVAIFRSVKVSFQLASSLFRVDLHRFVCLGFVGGCVGDWKDKQKFLWISISWVISLLDDFNSYTIVRQILVMDYNWSA